MLRQTGARYERICLQADQHWHSRSMQPQAGCATSNSCLAGGHTMSQCLSILRTMAPRTASARRKHELHYNIFILAVRAAVRRGIAAMHARRLATYQRAGPYLAGWGAGGGGAGCIEARSVPQHHRLLLPSRIPFGQAILPPAARAHSGLPLSQHARWWAVVPAPPMSLAAGATKEAKALAKAW